MKRSLNAKTVGSIKAPAKGQIEVFDRGYPGLALRVSYGGGKSFTTYYFAGTKHRRMTLGIWPAMDLAEARDAWRQVREAVARGEDPARAKQGRKPGMSFDVVVEEWLRRDQGKNKASTQRQVAGTVERDLLPAWTGRRVDDISKRDVLTLLDGIVDRGAAVGARRTFAYVRRFFSWCIERDILTVHPMAGMKKPGGEKSRDHVLANDELVKIWHAAAAEGPYGEVVRLLMLTGCRLAEISELRWAELKADRIELPATRTKGGEAVMVPLSSAARSVTMVLEPIEGCEFVFTTDGEKPVASWSRVKKRLDATSGVTGWRLHDLRRTFSTGLNEHLGVEPHIVEACLGHKIRGVAGVYNKAKYEAAKRAAAEAWGAHILALVAGRKAGVVVPMVKGAK